MDNSKFMIKFTTFIVLSVLFVLPSIMSIFIKNVPNGPQPGYTGASRVSVQGERIYEQEFISDVDNLSAIGMSIKNPNLKNKSEVLFQILDENKNILREITLNGFNIDDGSYMKVNFEPIQNSKDKTLYLVISSTFAKEDEVLELFIIEPTDVVKRYLYNGEIMEGGTPMVLYAKSGGIIDNVVSVYSNLLSKLLRFGS